MRKVTIIISILSVVFNSIIAYSEFEKGNISAVLGWTVAAIYAFSFLLYLIKDYQDAK